MLDFWIQGLGVGCKIQVLRAEGCGVDFVTKRMLMVEFTPADTVSPPADSDDPPASAADSRPLRLE